MNRSPQSLAWKLSIGDCTEAVAESESFLKGTDKEVLREAHSLIDQNQLSGWVYQRFLDNGAVPQEIKLYFYQKWKQQWLKSLVQEEALREIDAAFAAAASKNVQKVESKAPLKATLLKGSALIGDLYSHLGQRARCDLDLLVNESDWARVCEVLVGLNYEHQAEELWEANQFKALYVKRASSNSSNETIVIELHSRLFYQHDNSDLWSRQPHREYRNLSRLGNEEQLVHLLGHLGYQHTFLMLHWFLDIDLFLRKYGSEIDVAKVRTILKALRQKRSARIIFWVLKKYFKTPLPEGLNEGSRILEVCLAVILDENFLWSSSPPRWKYFLLKHLAKDRLRDALIYDWNWLKARFL